MNTNKKIAKNIERLGERYCRKYLDIWDKKALENNWWDALNFFFSHSFMRGRSDKLSNEYHLFTISVLEDYFSIKGQDLTNAYNSLKNQNSFFDKNMILNFKEKKNIRIGNSIKDKDFGIEILSKNPLIKTLLTQKEIEVKWEDTSYRKKIHLGNDRDIMMVLDVLDFISSENIKMNIYNYLKNKIKTGIKSAYKELINIYAVGDKIAAFTIRDIGMMNLKNVSTDIRFAFPVDTWVFKIAKKLGCEDMNIENVKSFFIEICEKNKINPLKVNAGLWFLGFNSLDILLDNLGNIEILDKG